MPLQRINRLTSHYCRSCATILLAIVSLFFANGARAQDSPEMSATYGRGVHAYFGNRMSDAEQLFSRVINAGSTDPRVYYFRAMARLRSGRQYEAEEDMRIGAAFEARNPGKRHSIGIALQRIQGQGRRTLERFRREGRLNYVQQRRQQVQSRYEQLKQRDPQVLRREAPVPLDQLVGPAPQEVPQLELPSNVEPEAATPTPAEDDLFSDPAAQPVESPEVPPGADADDATDDLFGEPAPAEPNVTTPAPEEADDDLFGSAAETEADQPMVEEEAAAGDDLFGDPAAEESATEEDAEAESTDPTGDPFGDSDAVESADDQDPFGEGLPVEESATESETPATDESDSGEESTESDDEDPFAGATNDDAAEVGELAESDKVESKTLFGILGRVASSTVPWRNVQLPKVPGLPGTAGGPLGGTADSIPLGPQPSSPDGVQPAAAEEDLFGSTTETESVEDPFGDTAEDPFESLGEGDESTSFEAEEGTEETATEEESQLEDDLFGDS